MSRDDHDRHEPDSGEECCPPEGIPFWSAEVSPSEASSSRYG